MEEVTSHPAEQRPIDSCKSTAKECPLFAAVMWDSGVGMVEVGEHNNPFAHEEFWVRILIGRLLFRDVLTMIRELQ